jgi:hypothetical protein
MKKQIPTPAAAALIILALTCLVGLGWWMSGKYTDSTGDVRPVINEMNANKPKTEPLPPDTDVVFMGGGGPAAPSGSLPVNKGKK